MESTEEVLAVDSNPAISEATDFELQAQAVAKETGSIMASTKPESEMTAGTSSQNINAYSNLAMDFTTIPILVNFKSSPEALDATEIRAFSSASDERNNNNLLDDTEGNSIEPLEPVSYTEQLREINKDRSEQFSTVDEKENAAEVEVPAEDVSQAVNIQEDILPEIETPTSDCFESSKDEETKPTMPSDENPISQTDENDEKLLSKGLENLKLDEPLKETVVNIKVHPLLEDYECYFKWVAKTESEIKPVTEEEIATIEKVIYDKFTDSAAETEENALKYNGMEIVSYKATQAFCNILLKKFEDGRIQISETEELINKCIAAENDVKEYTGGLNYVLRGLQMFLLCQRLEVNAQDEEAKEQLDLLIPTSEPFNCLTVKGQVGVLAMKYFFGAQRRQGAQQTLILEEIMSSDESHIWYYQLYNLLRISRRDQQFRSEPTSKEKNAILKAAELAPEHPLHLLGICQCVLEIFRNRNAGSSSWKEKIEMGSIATFKSSQELVDFVKERTKKVLQLHGDSVKANITVAEFFTVLLPYPFRDNKLAKECISRALEIAPNSSRANHRMGIFCLTSEADPKEALKHFERALETDPRNFPALADVIQTSLGDPLTNSERLKKIFKEHLENSVWPNIKLATLHYFYGIFMNMKRDSSAAIDQWITAYQMHPESIKSFKSINYFCNRYKWNRKDVSLMGVQSVLKKGLEERSSKEELETIGKILEIVSGAVADIAEKNAIHDANRRGRGGRGGFHSHVTGSTSRPVTGQQPGAASEDRPNAGGYRGVGRGSRAGIQGSRGARGNGERINNVPTRQPFGPEEGRGFAPRGNSHRGAATQPMQNN